MTSGLARITVMVTFFLSSAAVADDFDQGMKAFRAGNVEQALQHWQPLADQGDAKAQNALGMLHEYGRGVARDDELAITWYAKAAEQGLPEAQYRLGVLHEHGWGVARDPGLAAAWYERAAQQDHALAQHDLAFMYLQGSGVPADRVAAYMWLKIASVQRADLMAKHLAHVSKLLSASEIQRAEMRARAWLAGQKI